MSLRHIGLAVLAMGCAHPATGQAPNQGRPLPQGYGSLTQDDLSLRVGDDNLVIRFVPLDPRLMPLLARDAAQSLRFLLDTQKRAVDSVASRAGVATPGIGLVSFFGQRADARFDPQTLTILIRNRVFRPLGVIALSPRFNSQQLGVREQARALYLFEEDIPVNDSFVLSYGVLTSQDWEQKLPLLDRERARVAARSRTEPIDTGR